MASEIYNKLQWAESANVSELLSEFVAKPDGDRGTRHNAALRAPVKWECPIVHALLAIAEYRMAYWLEFDANVLEDVEMAPHVVGMCEAVIGLLNGPTGRLDCGTLHTALSAAIRQANE